MEITKTTRSLILISIIAIVFDLARLDIWGTSNLLYLIWNLVLAWVPYIVSLYFIKKDISVNRFVPIFFLWLLFFPNAPYLVTDVVHVAESSGALLWYDSLLLFFFGWIGLFLGMLSIFHIHQYLKAHFNYFISEISIFIIFLISSFGIYLGRFERLNSWNILNSPLILARSLFGLLINITHAGTQLLFVLFFTVFMYSVYKTMYLFLE